MVAERRSLRQRILSLVVFGALWCLLIKHLSLHWATNPEYSFGWFGPILCAYLFFIRWVSRPAAEPATFRAAKWFFCIAGLAVLPTWLIEQPNPD
jgi:hypothetical protein